MASACPDQGPCKEYTAGKTAAEILKEHSNMTMAPGRAAAQRPGGSYGSVHGPGAADLATMQAHDQKNQNKKGGAAPLRTERGADRVGDAAAAEGGARGAAVSQRRRDLHRRHERGAHHHHRRALQVKARGAHLPAALLLGAGAVAGAAQGRTGGQRAQPRSSHVLRAGDDRCWPSTKGRVGRPAAVYHFAAVAV
eukprot:CAMPEP_0182584370 /NCGR_PEP_ID=MMETSP1324-20130603/57597_1 /TAXON_ID=236786 /ORGANISM="Florenciella sp., Strain RCC1587" /LENGTH=194 /DNA_ID=CAMNT_0024801051 /DNA_START=9 /DNA_END=588 /DNA_ORIENTATION=+